MSKGVGCIYIPADGRSGSFRLEPFPAGRAGSLNILSMSMLQEVHWGHGDESMCEA